MYDFNTPWYKAIQVESLIKAQPLLQFTVSVLLGKGYPSNYFPSQSTETVNCKKEVHHSRSFISFLCVRRIDECFYSRLTGLHRCPLWSCYSQSGDEWVPFKPVHAWKRPLPLQDHLTPHWNTLFLSESMPAKPLAVLSFPFSCAMYRKKKLWVQFGGEGGG